MFDVCFFRSCNLACFGCYTRARFLFCVLLGFFSVFCFCFAACVFVLVVVRAVNVFFCACMHIGVVLFSS